MTIDTCVIGGVAVGLYGSSGEIVKELIDLWNSGASPSAIAVNPEKVVAAMDSPKVLQILEAGTVRYIDGIGVAKVASLRSGRKIPRIPGCELWEDLMLAASREHMPVYLVGAQGHVIEAAKSRLIQEYGVVVVGASDGYFTDEDKLISQIKSSGASIVTVALGSPKQEHFIERCQAAGIHAIFMGVGGTYDVFTRNVRRAPYLFQKIGCEWLYRLCSQPTRSARQLRLLRYLAYAATNRI